MQNIEPHWETFAAGRCFGAACYIQQQIYFGSSITVTKMVGILLALSGFFWFGFSKKKKVTTANEPSTVVTTRIPSPKALGATDYNQNTSHTLEMVKIEAI